MAQDFFSETLCEVRGSSVSKAAKLPILQKKSYFVEKAQKKSYFVEKALKVLQNGVLTKSLIHWCVLFYLKNGDNNFLSDFAKAAFL